MKANFSIRTCGAVVLLSIVAIFSGLASAQEAPVESKVLVVGTKESPPFSMKGADGPWTGISIELWRHIADGLDLKYEFKEMALPEILDGVSSGGIDAGIAAITITSEREKRMDFSHAFYSTGLGIAVLEQNRSPWLNVLKRLLSPAFLKVATSLALLLLVVGLLVWALERKKNPGQFGGPTLKGIGSGFWWSAVTMTTVGYGDKAPLTPLGRVVSIIWMFAGVILISGFTAAITASLTVSELTSKVKNPNDLHRFAVGAVLNTTSEAYLREQNIGFFSFASADEGLEAVAKEEIDAFVYDAPLLKYLIRRKHSSKLKVLAHVVSPQSYGIALNPGSALREPINRNLLAAVKEAWWREMLARYLGE